MLLLALLAVLAPLAAPSPPLEPHPADRLTPPSLRYPLGTDDIGRDNQLSRIIYGARVSLAVGAISIGLALALGVPLGLLAGYWPPSPACSSRPRSGSATRCSSKPR